MNDLISRQAAIDAVENAFDRETILNRFVRKIAISALRKMPSAQPEQRWIPVSEKLPNFAQRVLVSTANFVYEAIYFDEDAGWSTYNVTFKDVEESEILAWMPLPEPYAEEQNG